MGLFVPAGESLLSRLFSHPSGLLILCCRMITVIWIQHRDADFFPRFDTLSSNLAVISSSPDIFSNAQPQNTHKLVSKSLAAEKFSVRLCTLSSALFPVVISVLGLTAGRELFDFALLRKYTYTDNRDPYLCSSNLAHLYNVSWKNIPYFMGLLRLVSYFSIVVCYRLWKYPLVYSTRILCMGKTLRS